MALDPRIILSAGQTQNPLMSLVEGFQTGQDIRTNMLAQQAAQQKMQQAAALQPLKQQALEQELLAQQEAQARLAREDATTQRLAKINQLSQMAAVIEPHIESGNIEAAKSALTANASLFNPEYVSGMMGDFEAGDIEGLKAGIGDIKRLRASLDVTKAKSATSTANIKDFEYYEKLKKTNPEGARLFAKDVGLLPKDSDLSSVAEKALIESQDRYFELSTNAREYSALAGDFERFQRSLPAGVKGTFTEFMKSVTGSQDEFTELRRRFAKVRLAEALQYLPPGPATDKDIEEAFKGVPKENASVDQSIRFLRGAEKIARIESEFQEFKSNYISENNGTKGMIKEWKRKIKNNEVSSINALTATAKDKKAAPQAAQTDEFKGFKVIR